MANSWRFGKMSFQRVALVGNFRVGELSKIWFTENCHKIFTVRMTVNLVVDNGILICEILDYDNMNYVEDPTHKI